MCKHITFDRNRWAPCAVCMTEKRVAATIKNKGKILALIAELTQEAEAIEAQGRKARFERTEIAGYEKMLAEAA